jgi:hypothetical protein
MVTLAYFIVLILSLTHIVLIDMFLYKSTFFEAWHSILYITVGTGRWIVIFACVVGMVLSVINDIRLIKNKQKPRLEDH